MNNNMKVNILLPAIVAISVIFSCGKKPDLGNGFMFEYDQRGDIYLIKTIQPGDAPSVIVNGHIMDYSFDSTFIIIAERPRDSVPECSGKIQGMTKKKCDDAFERSSFKQYWIINKQRKTEFDAATRKYTNVYGPFHRQQMIQKIAELGVPRYLTLKE